MFTAEQIAIKNMELSTQYADYRAKAAKAKYELDVLISSNMEELLDRRKNIGYEMAVIALLSNDMVKVIHRDYLKYTALYKGLERVIDANSSFIMLKQSIMKHELKGEMYG